jgi:hypothetical protein
MQHNHRRAFRLVPQQINVLNGNELVKCARPTRNVLKGNELVKARAAYHSPVRMTAKD